MIKEILDELLGLSPSKTAGFNLTSEPLISEPVYEDELEGADRIANGPHESIALGNIASSKTAATTFGQGTAFMDPGTMERIAERRRRVQGKWNARRDRKRMHRETAQAVGQSRKAERL